MSKHDRDPGSASLDVLSPGENLFDQDGLGPLITLSSLRLGLELDRTRPLVAAYARIIGSHVGRVAASLAARGDRQELRLTNDHYRQIISALPRQQHKWSGFGNWCNDQNIEKTGPYRYQLLQDYASKVLDTMGGGLWPLYLHSYMGRGGYTQAGAPRSTHINSILNTAPTFTSWVYQCDTIMQKLGIEPIHSGGARDIRYRGDWAIPLGGFEFKEWDSRRGKLNRLLTLWTANQW